MTYTHFRDLGVRGVIETNDQIALSQADYAHPRYVSISDFISSSTDYSWIGSPLQRFQYLMEWSQNRHLRLASNLRVFAEQAQLVYRRTHFTPNEGGGNFFSPLGAGAILYSSGATFQSFGYFASETHSLREARPQNELNENRLAEIIGDPANAQTYLSRLPENLRYSYLYWAAQYNFQVLRFTYSSESSSVWQQMIAELRTRFPEAGQYSSPQELIYRLHALGIQRPHRFYTISSALTIIRNGSIFNPCTPNDQKRVLVISMAKDDWNGGFVDGSLSKAIDTYSQDYKIFYQENENEIHAQTNLNAGLRINPNQTHYAFVLGHGSAYGIELTSRSSDETHHLDEEDLINGEISFRGYASVSFIACSTGRSLVRTAANTNRGIQFSGPNRDFYDPPQFGFAADGTPSITYERGVRNITLTVPQS